ncbi:MAG TPA: hypothetical protein VGN14_08560, partial [Candidatus Elarobacter sp.]
SVEAGAAAASAKPPVRSGAAQPHSMQVEEVIVGSPLAADRYEPANGSQALGFALYRRDGRVRTTI